MIYYSSLFLVPLVHWIIFVIHDERTHHENITLLIFHLLFFLVPVFLLTIPEGTSASAIRHTSAAATANSSTSTMSEIDGNSKKLPNQMRNFVDLTATEEPTVGVKTHQSGAVQNTPTPTIQTQTLSSGSIAPAHGAGFDPSKVLLFWGWFYWIFLFFLPHYCTIVQ